MLLEAHTCLRTLRMMTFAPAMTSMFPVLVMFFKAVHYGLQSTRDL